MKTKILIVGNISSGKSTFLNCLVEGNIFPMDVCKVNETIIGLDYNNCVICEIPGLNDERNGSIKIFKNDIKYASHIFYIMTQEHIYSHSTQCNIEKICELRNYLKNKSIHFVLNKCDKLTSEQMLKLTNDIRAKYHTLIKEHQPYCVSTKNYLLSILFNKNLMSERQKNYVKKILYGTRRNDTDIITSNNMNILFKDSQFSQLKNYIDNLKFNEFMKEFLLHLILQKNSDDLTKHSFITNFFSQVKRFIFHNFLSFIINYTSTSVIYFGEKQSLVVFNDYKKHSIEYEAKLIDKKKTYHNIILKCEQTIIWKL